MRVRAFYGGMLMIVAMTVAVVASCTSDTISGPLVVLSNTWREATNAQHTFSIQDNTNGTPKREGTFTGTETTANFVEFPFEGYWNSDGYVQFTVHRATNVTYSGRLTSNPDRMELNSSAGQLVLVRN